MKTTMVLSKKRKKATMEEEADRSELPMDLLELIVRRLDRFPGDHVRFGAVCKSWRSIAMQNRCHIPLNQFPGLMVPGINENSQTRCFKRLNHETCYFEEDCATLEVPHGHACSGSAYGWLFSVDDKLNTQLLNPFSGAKIQLPSVATLLPPALKGFHPRIKGYVCKAIFSSNPSFFQLQPRAPVILIIYGGSTPRLAYCKPGDEAWTALECLNVEKYYFLDVIYYQDRFLALDADGEILALDIGTSTDGHCKVNVTQYAYIPGIECIEYMFLVEVQGDLVALTGKINEDMSDDDDDDDDEKEEEEDDDEDNYEGIDYRYIRKITYYRTAGFTLLRLERTGEHKWVKVRNLGDNALFVGYNTSFSLRASDYSGCIPNSIYFTNASEVAGSDMGVYNLTDKSIKPLYPIGYGQLTEPSPIWVTRLPCS